MDNSKLVQGSPEWHAARIGKITGSRFKDVLSKKDGVTRAKYMRELLLERKTGISVDGYFDKNMANGQNVEPQARAYYEGLYEQVNCFIKVEQVGFIDHLGEQYKGYVGVSPDGLVGNDGCIEIKCPNTATHLGYISKNVMPPSYIPQVQGVMWVTGRVWCDFISFDPRVPEQPYFCIRVERDQSYIDKLAAAVDVFIQEMVEMQKNQVEVDPQLLRDVTAGGCSELDWQIKLRDDIRGKVKHGLSCAVISNEGLIVLDEQKKKALLQWVDFVMSKE
uniref:Putative exonuclease n=1 Tax=viral metagenome TaxID=1070528 RepID=A0A6M3XFM4_9ZZZZ